MTLFAGRMEENLPYLIIGLGNPGREYKQNRHNVGCMVLDALAKRLGLTFGRVESQALVAKAIFQGRRLVLAKPQTYMNRSGTSAASLLRFYKTPLSQFLVAYDDVDLPLGTLRLRPDGGSAGQKGMASIIERIGTQNFPRLRLGIGRPPGRMDAAAYVLQDFTAAEREVLEPTLERAVDAVLLFVTEGLNAAMNRYNGTGADAA